MEDFIPWRQQLESAARTMKMVGQNESARDQAEFENDWNTFKLATMNISSGIVAYCPPNTDIFSPSERQEMLNSVVKTRAFFKTKPDIFSRFYMGFTGSGLTKEGVKHKIDFSPSFSNHFATIVIADALTWGLQNKWQIRQGNNILINHTLLQALSTEILDEVKGEGDLLPVLFQIIEKIYNSNDQKQFKGIILKTPSYIREEAIRSAIELNYLIAPTVNFLDIYTGDFSIFEDKGWQIHKASQFSTWVRDTNRSLQNSKQEFIDTLYPNPKRYDTYLKSLLQPLMPRAVLLTENTKRFFSDLPSDIPLDGTHVGIEYRLFHPPFGTREGNYIPSAQSFYITRPFTRLSLLTFLNEIKEEEMNEKVQRMQELALILHSLYCDSLYIDRLPLENKNLRWQRAAELGFTPAIHNSGLFLENDDSASALDYYQMSADRGFAPALRNYSLLLREVAPDHPHLPLYNDMSQLAGESLNLSAIPGMFFEPPSLEAAFNGVIFNPQPYGIKLRNSIKVKNGDLEVYFRDPAHLRTLMAQFPLLSADNIYFIYNLNTHDGHEFKAPYGELIKSKFIHVMADQALNVEGYLDSQYDIVLPKESDINSLSRNSGQIITNLSIYEQGLKLAEFLESLDKTLVLERTEQARKLFEDRKRDRQVYPEKYPQRLADIAPKRYIISDGAVKMVQSDYLHAESDIIFMAPNLSDFKQLISQLTPFTTGSYIFLINPLQDLTGIYSDHNPFLSIGFEITSEKNLLTAGSIVIPDYDLSIKVKGNWWHYANLRAKNINVKVGRNLSLINIFMSSNQSRPHDLPLPLWQKLKEFYWKEYKLFLKD